MRFCHREQVEGPIDECNRAESETAIQIMQSLHMEDMKFNKVFELAKRAEQTSKVGSIIKDPERAQKAKSIKPKGTINGNEHRRSKISRERLTPKGMINCERECSCHTRVS